MFKKKQYLNTNIFAHYFLFNAQQISMNDNHMNHISHKNRLRCYAKSPIVQDVFPGPIPDLISCAGVTGGWGLLSHLRCIKAFFGIVENIKD